MYRNSLQRKVFLGVLWIIYEYSSVQLLYNQYITDHPAPLDNTPVSPYRLYKDKSDYIVQEICIYFTWAPTHFFKVATHPCIIKQLWNTVSRIPKSWAPRISTQVNEKIKAKHRNIALPLLNMFFFFRFWFENRIWISSLVHHHAVSLPRHSNIFEGGALKTFVSIHSVANESYLGKSTSRAQNITSLLDVQDTSACRILYNFFMCYLEYVWKPQI